MRRRWSAAAAVLVGAALSASAAGVGSGGAAAPELGKPEGKLALLQWPGYSDPSFASDFERRTGCRITRRNVRSSAQMVDLMKTGRYDLVSASGDVSGLMIARKLVRPVDLRLVPGWRQLAPPFRSPPYNTVGGKHYGITVMWTPNLLLANEKRAEPFPASWRAIYDQRFEGKVSIPDNPMQIADAALYLKSSEPRLRIRNPYELTAAQLDGVVALLRRQRPLVTRYWRYATEQIQDFRTGDAVVGAGWPYQTQVLQTARVPVRQTLPREGATAWADSWMLARRAQHPNCAYLWLRHVISAPVQAQAALVLRESPVNPRACPLMGLREEGSCAAYFGNSPPRLLRRLAFWRTPSARCGWSAKARCVPYSGWQKAWARATR